ncbi:nucleotidyltransferase family protein [Methanoculleus bourgensis]|uniref:nucleotidyltransferase family protein n=1 Tax=Methanoculleus bourgensis TaxID=83986 RepID=UPI001BD929E0|nr:nucleotidyltransferase family protein [Methanoculleus bourgensis]MBT0733643.1 nucleotidyltransferase family protein [Methanoculleus bourgensis]
MRGQCTCYRTWTTGPTSLPFLSRNGGEILSLAERRGARNVRVFGSVARDEARADSDVDFLVDLDPDQSLLDVGGLAMDLSLLLDRPVDVVTEAGLRERIRSRVVREARPL